MAFKTDNGGFAFKANDAKLQANASTWATRFHQFARMDGVIRILTYSLPNMEYVREQLARRPRGIFIIVHSKFADRAQEIRREFPEINIGVHPEMHSKGMLAAPRTIMVSSANFGDSSWHETTGSFHSKEAHDWYVENVFEKAWRESQVIM